MKKQVIISRRNLYESMNEALSVVKYDKAFVLTDVHTLDYCLPLLQDTGLLADAPVVTIGVGDACKNLDSLSKVWACLSDGGATRHSLLVNLGGGMVTDLGGFAAATFKRGISCVHVPTTLLAMVDASVGGKTGINFGGLKNEIGAFAPGAVVVLETAFLQTLDRANYFSGYAEMLKHGLLSTVSHWAELLNLDEKSLDYRWLNRLVAQSVAVKEGIVAQDPFERSLRKSLNLGHTVGHALESLALEEGRPVLHGYAVAWGLVCELYLSALKVGFPADRLRQTVSFIRAHYGDFDFSCRHYDRLYALMLHDKKNTLGTVNFTLLQDVGRVVLDQTATRDEIFELFDFLRDG